MIRGSSLRRSWSLPGSSRSRSTSARALCAVASAVLSGALVASCDPAGVEAPALDAARPAHFARVFVDVTAQSGLDFRHVTGGYGDKLLPETLGSGAALLDYDGDGRLDAFLVNSCHWPGREPPGVPPPSCRLFRGIGGGRFTDVTGETGAGISLYGMGCAVADFDADGDDDIYITALGDNVLLRNDGGRFRDVTAVAGVAGGTWRDESDVEHPEWSTAAAWADFDGDDDLDLFVANYVQWTPLHEVFTSLDGVTKAFTTPDRYVGLPCRLFLQRDDGSFADASRAAGLLGLAGKSLGTALWDFDDDGLLDVVVANDTRPNFLFLNRGDGRFEESALEYGIAYDDFGRARAGMGIDIAALGDDLAPAIAIGNFSEEPMSLWRRAADGRFESRAGAAGLSQATHEPLAFAVAFCDIDLDASLDLVVVNGHIEPEIERFGGRERYAQSAQIFRGVDGGRFEDVSALAGSDFARPRVGRGLATGDIDGDGDLDLLVTANGGAAVLLRNDAAPGAPRARWLRVRLRQPGKNREALGARITLDAGGRRQVRTVRSGSSYSSESERVETFGLGTATRIDRLRVRWPHGVETDHPPPDPDRVVTLRRE